AQPLAKADPAPRRRGLVGQRLANLLPRERGGASLAQARQRHRQRERLRFEQLAKHRVLAVAALVTPGRSPPLQLPGGEMENAVGLKPREQRISVPRRQDRLELIGVGRVPREDHPKTEERGNQRKADSIPPLEEVLDRGQHAVARTALLRGRPLVDEASFLEPGHPREYVSTLHGL